MEKHPKMTMKDRQDMQVAFEKLNDGSWKKVASENDFERHQVYFWFLVESDKDGLASFRVLRNAFRQAVEEFPGEDFVFSFDKIDERNHTIIESIRGPELGRKDSLRKFGSRPYVSKKLDFSVFDRDL